MTKDPVCGRDVDQQKAQAKTTHQDRDYLFCSDNCKQKFDEHPERYTHQMGAQQRQQQRGTAA